MSTLLEFALSAAPDSLSVGGGGVDDDGRGIRLPMEKHWPEGRAVRQLLKDVRAMREGLESDRKRLREALEGVSHLANPRCWCALPLPSFHSEACRAATAALAQTEPEPTQNNT